jgi:nucleotide-binding universal stress UspA family protein
MYKRILVAVDGTELSAAALGAALGLARMGGGTVVGVHVALESPFTESAGIGSPVHDAFRAQALQQGRDALAYVTRRAADAGIPCETVLAPAGPAWEGIIATARERACDVIVMAVHGRHGLAARMLGGETQRVLTHCDIPVLVVR